MVPPNAGAATREVAARMRGKRLPQVGNVEISVIEESNPRMLAFDPALARALLDKFGYVDRDGDGFRELPDGSPLTS